MPLVNIVKKDWPYYEIQLYINGLEQLDGLVQERYNSSALCLSCTNPLNSGNSIAETLRLNCISLCRKPNFWKKSWLTNASWKQYVSGNKRNASVPSEKRRSNVSVMRRRHGMQRRSGGGWRSEGRRMRRSANVWRSRSLRWRWGFEQRRLRIARGREEFNTWACFNIKTIFLGIGIPVIKLWWL